MPVSATAVSRIVGAFVLLVTVYALGFASNQRAPPTPATVRPPSSSQRPPTSTEPPTTESPPPTEQPTTESPPPTEPPTTESPPPTEPPATTADVPPPEPPVPEWNASKRRSADCPSTFRERQYRAAHFTEYVLGWSYGEDFHPARKRDGNYMYLHGTLTRDLPSVRTDFVNHLDAALPSPELKFPVEGTIRDPLARFDQITRDVVFTVAHKPSPDHWVKQMGVAIDVHSGAILDRCSFLLSTGYIEWLTPGGDIEIELARHAYRAMRDAPEKIVHLDPKSDGYIWAYDMTVGPYPGHALDYLSQHFGAHYDHFVKTGKNATMIINEPERWTGFYKEWIPFLRRHYPVDMLFLNTDATTVFRGNITFGTVFNVGARPSAAAFWGDMVVPSVLRWCRERKTAPTDGPDDERRCKEASFLDEVKWRGHGGPFVNRRKGVPGLRQRDGVVRLKAMVDRLEDRVYALATAEVVYYNWGGGGSVASYYMGGWMPVHHLPWPRRQLDGLLLRKKVAPADIEEGCEPVRPAQRVVLMASGRDKPPYKREILNYALQFGNVPNDDAEGIQTHTWYTVGEEMGLHFYPGALVKTVYFGDDGERYFPGSEAFDDAAFRLDDLSAEAVAAEDATSAAAAEVQGDDSLYDHLLRTQRVLLINQWVASASGPARRCHAEEASTPAAGRCNETALRPFPLAGSNLWLAPRALDTDTVYGESPSSKRRPVAHRTTGLARYFVGGTSDALLQSTTRLARWREAAPPAYANVVTTFIGLVDGGAVVIQPDGPSSDGIVVPNSHPCFGVLSEVTLVRPRDPRQCQEVNVHAARHFNDSDALPPPEGMTTALWLGPAPEGGGSITAADYTQGVLSRIGHLVLEGAWDALVKDEGVTVVVAQEPGAYARKAVDDLLSLFGVTRILRVRPNEPLSMIGVRVVVPPVLGSFRLQFSAQQFAATRWLHRHASLWPAAANYSAGVNVTEVKATTTESSAAGKVVVCTTPEDPDEYLDAFDALGPDLRRRANLTVARHALPSDVARMFQSGLTTLAVFHGPSVVQFAGLWAQSIPTPGASKQLNLVVLCPPAKWWRCHVSYAQDNVDGRSRFFSLGREYNLPHGVHLQYLLLRDSKYAATEAPPLWTPQSLRTFVELGRLNFKGIPATVREFGADPEQPTAEKERLRRGFVDAMANPMPATTTTTAAPTQAPPTTTSAPPTTRAPPPTPPAPPKTTAAPEDDE